MTTITLRDSGIVDNMISGSIPSINTVYSTDANLFVGAGTPPGVNRALFKFPGLVPPGGAVVVSSATLQLKNRDTEAATAPFEVRRLLTAWTPSQTTWINRATGTPWDEPGVLGGTDVDPTVIATGTSPTTTAYFTIAGAGFNQYVQDVLNGATDYGIIISFVNDIIDFDNISRRQGASENTIATDRPVLTVVYTITTPPTISVDDISVNSLSGTATFTLTLSDVYALPYVVYRKTTDDTATAPTDYTELPLALATFAPGETTKTVDVTIVP